MIVFWIRNILFKLRMDLEVVKSWNGKNQNLLKQSYVAKIARSLRVSLCHLLYEKIYVGKENEELWDWRKKIEK